MAAWDAVVRFHAVEDDKEYFASVPLGQTDFEGRQVEGYASIEDIENGAHSAKVRVKKVNIETGPSLTLMLLTHVKLLAPVPALQPVVCIGLNYRKHVEESGVSNVYPWKHSINLLTKSQARCSCQPRDVVQTSSWNCKS